jgi:type I protein arginine methyltransferase
LKSDEGWEDVEPEEVLEPVVSLLDDQIFSDVSSMLLHCKDKYNFDFLQIRNEFALDFYGTIRLVNYIRSEVKAGRAVTPSLPKEVLEDDRYLKPVLEDDALLFNLDDLPDVVPLDEVNTFGIVAADRSTELLGRVLELEQELRKTQSQFSNYKVAVQQTLDRRWSDEVGTVASRGAGEKTDYDSSYFSSYAYNGMYYLLFASHLSNCP